MIENPPKRYPIEALRMWAGIVPVSYTHLDVYKRQCKGCSRRAVALGQGNGGQSVAMPPGHQTRDLSPAVAAGVLQVPVQYSSLPFPPPRVVKACEYATDVPIPLTVVARRRELD